VTAPFIFLSYSRTEQAAADELHARLTNAGLAVFKDDINIRSGDRWLSVLEDALKQCGSFVVLLGSQGTQRWVGAEVGVALNRNFGPHDDSFRLPIHPLLLADTPADAMPPFLGQFQSERWRPGEELSDNLLDALRQQLPRLDTTRRIEGCPFVGLATFRRDQAHLFFGRINETLEAMAALGDQHQSAPGAAQAAGHGYVRWLQIEGHSGSGKSSLVNAGLLPLVERGALWPRTGLENWVVLGPMVPGEDPVWELAATLEDGLVADPLQRDTVVRNQALVGDERALKARLRDLKQANTGYLLVIDQFEELYNRSKEAQRKQFDALLANALTDPACPLFLVSTVRSDFLDRIEELPHLAEIYNSHRKGYLLPLVTPRGLQFAIEMPARLAQLDVSEVCTAMLHDAEGEPGALPLVENALRFLWRNAEGNGNGTAKLSGAVYRQHNGLAGMLSSEADGLLVRAERENKGDELAALELLLRLTQVSPEGRHTRQRISREDAVQAAGDGNNATGERVLALLAGERNGAAPAGTSTDTLRLITTGTETVAGDKTGAGATVKFVDLIHETLLRRRPDQGDKAGEPYWPALWNYIKKNADRDTLRRQLALQVQQWQSKKGAARLLRLASWQNLQDYARLRVPKQSEAGRFIARSHQMLQVWTVGVLVVVSSVTYAWRYEIENQYAKLDNTLSYALLVPVWQLGLHLPVPETVELPALPAGQTFEMGCKPGRDDVVGTCFPDETLRAVPMPAPCAMGKFEVTNLEYNRFLWEKEGKGFAPLGRYPANGIFGAPRHPVVNVRWDDANAYAAWLSAQNRGTYRLPSEAEWEYAARLGSKGGGYPWGNEAPTARANCAGCGGWYANHSSAPVGSYAASAGLHDMAGNVSEWTADRYRPESTHRVLRGGYWGDSTRVLRASEGDWAMADAHNDTIGFRVCRVSPSEKLNAGAPNAEKRVR
jgi:formylglycine-generating enzyme required for sulfatase activity